MDAVWYCGINLVLLQQTSMEGSFSGGQAREATRLTHDQRLKLKDSMARAERVFRVQKNVWWADSGQMPAARWSFFSIWCPSLTIYRWMIRDLQVPAMESDLPRRHSGTASESEYEENAARPSDGLWVTFENIYHKNDLQNIFLEWSNSARKKIPL